MALQWYNLEANGVPDQVLNWIISPSHSPNPMSNIDGDTNHLYNNAVETMGDFRQTVTPWTSLDGDLVINRVRVQGMIAGDSTGGYLNFGIDLSGSTYWVAGDMWTTGTYTHKVKDFYVHPVTGVAWTAAELLTILGARYRGWSYGGASSVKITYGRVRVYADFTPWDVINLDPMVATVSNPGPGHMLDIQPLVNDARIPAAGHMLGLNPLKVATRIQVTPFTPEQIAADFVMRQKIAADFTQTQKHAKTFMITQGIEKEFTS